MDTMQTHIILLLAPHMKPSHILNLNKLP